MDKQVIPGTKGFKADTLGNIYDQDNNLRKVYTNGDGYITASVLLEDGRWITYGVHRLTALAHLAREEGRNEVNHLDGVISNNKLINLEWVTAAENNIHSELLCRDNDFPRLVIYKDSIPVAAVRNLWEAENLIQEPYLKIWQCIKNNVTLDGYSFSYRHRGTAIPKELQVRNSRFKEERGVKTLDHKTGDVEFFGTFRIAGDRYSVGPSLVFQMLQRYDRPKLMLKRYQVAYADDEFTVYSKEQLDYAMSHGPKDVIAYNSSIKQYVVYESAAAFLRDQKLSKKAVTTALAENRLRTINGWTFTYLNDENFQRLKHYVNGPEVL